MKWIAAELLETAEASTGLAPWRLAVLNVLRRHVPWDDTFWGTSPSSTERDGQVFVCAEPGAPEWSAFFEAPERYRIPIAMKRTLQGGGVGVDTEMLSTAFLDGTPMYAEILRPLGVRTTMTVIPSFRGLPTSCIGFSRHDRIGRFRPAERKFLLEAVPAIGAVEMAFRAARAREVDCLRSDPLEPLSRREKQVATLVAQGFSNKEVGALLGTSSHTVRKQAIGVYAKLRVGGRAQLAALLARAGAARD